ncbi:MAG: glycosyltransferase family 87 protein [Acidobacteriaceae bacterium]
MTETKTEPVPEPVKRSPTPASSIWTKVGVIALLAVVAVMIGLVMRADATNHDFISYWSTAKLMAARANPYDAPAILHLENAAGGHYARPFIMRNPPWALFLVLPLGWLPVPLAGVLWTLSIVAAAVVSVVLLRPGWMEQVPLNAWFFAPAMMCVAAGQTATFLLLGVSLFLHFERRRPFVAGLALLLPAMKPHLFFLFWPLLLLECWRRRSFLVLGGLALGIALATAFAMAFDPHVWAHYAAALRGEDIGRQFLPNLACSLRALDPKAVWLQGIPTVVGLAVALWFWARHRRGWEWQRDGAMIFGASALTAPYSWPTDLALFLPAVLRGYRDIGKATVAVLTALNVAAILVAIRHPLMTPWAYVWMGPAWFLWCRWAGRRQESGIRD